MPSYLAAVVRLLSLISLASAKCQGFQPQYFGENTIDYAFTATQRSFVVSPVVNCSTAPGQTTPGQFSGDELRRCASNQCYLSVLPNYFIRFNRTLSIDVSATEEQNVFDVVKQYFGPALRMTDFNSTRIWPVSQIASCINESMAGYWGYTPIYYCIEGNLTDCEQSTGPSDGTFIRACGIKATSSGSRFADGVVSYVQAYGVESQPAPPNATDTAATSVASGDCMLTLGWPCP